ncbi:transglycosylase SLT domain-containing protein [Diplocloster agilis]|uniref:transglycosylase SLT domain-containing protein n=1 Tax=Diplocloster agilis TaxID=2850323 RepID=UPI000822CE33|nr:transglycosylase SLT domain-containing protein [Suonthocola fibrivorans]MCU6736843.1 transglycosylase SLT domain-containing protein [Suonthocola fibrivorans]SCJ93960.1 invasion protein IagB [uncultured Clostridium sp.]
MNNLKRKLLVTPVLLLLLAAVMPMNILGNEAEENRDSLRTYIESISEEYNICPELVEAIIEAESNWNPQAVNGQCIGLMQINSYWHQDRMERLGAADLTDPRQNILVGIDYLSQLFSENEDIYLILMKYNMCQDTAYQKWRAGDYSNYAVSVAARSSELEREHGK